MIRIMRRPRVLVTVLLGCLVLAGCGSGPSQVRAAVLIGDHEITVDQVQQVIDRAVREQPAAQQLAQQHKLDLVGRAVVGQFVIHELITRAAQREGLHADPVQVNQAMDVLAQPVSVGSTDPSELPGQIALRARDRTEAATDYVLERQLGEKYINHLSVIVDYTTVAYDENGVTRREQARAKAEQFASSPNGAHPVIEADRWDRDDAQENVPFFAAAGTVLQGTAIFGVPPGTVVSFEAIPSRSLWVVAVVRKRDLTTPVPASEVQGPPSPETLAALGRRLLQPDVDSSGVKINPRYGVWDPIAMNVAPSAAESAGFILPVKGYVQP